MHDSLLSLAAVLLLSALPGQARADLGASPAGDCSLARDPARCAAKLGARSACRDKSAVERRRCQQALLPEPDCGRARYPANCAAQAAARSACKEQSGSDYRRCMKRRVPGWRSWN